ncbi:DUF418 domain-containing protein [Streptomyces sp. NPDC015501]|uniref:DUF418 domain-containing protein n=1 Tax=unclassified Streptomyces TaxID=2593676 RepID=UPI0011A7EA1E
MSAPRTAPAAPPVARIGDIDVLRGAALLGILLVNAPFMAGPAAALGGGAGAGLADRGAAWATTALVTGKFSLLFSFLSGYGFTVQRRSAERAGVAFAPRHLRRTAALFLLGLVHAVLLFPGDILMTYAALGLILFALRDVRPRRLLRIAAVLLASLAALFLAYGLLALVLDRTQGPGAVAADPGAAYREGPGSVVRTNIELLPGFLGANVLYSAELLAAFLAGLAAGGLRVLAGPGPRPVLLRRVVALGLPLGLAGGAFVAVCTHGPLDGGWFFVGQAVGIVTAPALTAAYACGLLLLVRTPAGRGIGAALAPAGRMSLTHYLAQSLVLALVFTGYGLGLYGRVGAATVLGGCLFLYAAQLALSALLSRRRRSGPAEFLLRAATRGGFPRGLSRAHPA